MLNMLGLDMEEIKRHAWLAYNELIRIRKAQERQAEALEEIVELLKSMNNRGELLLANMRDAFR